MIQAQSDQADFSYDKACDPAGLPARVAIFADRGGMRRQIAADLAGAGFRSVDGGEVGALLDGPITMLGDVVMVDCPVVDGQVLAALTRLDMRVSRSGAQLIVSTSLDALDDVFAALDQCQPQILVQPTRAERIVAVGRILAGIGSARVREMSEGDRVRLLHLAQEVESIAQKLEGLSGPVNQANARLGEPSRGWNGAPAKDAASRDAVPLRPAVHAPLPEPRIVRQMIAARQARAKFFDGELFADPAWDMLLDLTAAHAENKRVSVTSLCIAAGVPATTALRWIKQMVDTQIFERIADCSDKRRAFIALSERSLDAMARYFGEVEGSMARAA